MSSEPPTPFWRKSGNAAVSLGVLLASLRELSAQVRGWPENGVKALSLLDWVTLAIAPLVALLSGVWLLGAVFHRARGVLGRELFRLLALLVAILISAAAWRYHLLSWVVAVAGTAYACARLWYWLGRTRPRIFRTDIFTDYFPADAPLGAGWDEVHPGLPTQMVWAKNGLLLSWKTFSTYRETGYLVKYLPTVDLQVEALIEPRVYERGWDPGLHFYPKNSMIYCLSIGLVPQGHGAEEYRDISGLSVRTDNRAAATGWVEHGRVAVAPNHKALVKVDLRGNTAHILIEGQTFDVPLDCRPDEVVVGAWKFQQPGGQASATAEYFIHHVKLVRL